MWKQYIILLGIFGLSLGSKIDPELLKHSEAVDILVSFGQIPATIYKSSSIGISRTNHISNLVSSLKEHSDRLNKDVLDFLKSKNVPFQKLWITNQLSIKGCLQDIIKMLSEFPQVTRISEDIHYPLEEVPLPTQVHPTKVEDTPEWGLNMVQAPEANSLLLDTLGIDNMPEIRVVVVDTGILQTHQALKNNFLGTYGWYDPTNGRQDPYDDNGHGTHVTGTICGTNGIGVYPSAKFLSCKGCGTSCPSSALIACGQFAICPHLPDGSNANCSYAGHVVSNSWNGGQGQTWLDPVIEAWHSAGVIPVFSSGNTGPPCGTVSSPADRNVIAVGSTTNIDSISYFSAVGPSVFGEIRPHVTAPGHDIRSAWNTGDSAYATASGTSMACPHTSGVIALLLAYKSLSFDQVKQALFSNADTANLVASGRNCGGVNESEFPNNVYGYGRINALETLKSVIADFPRPTTEPPTEEPTTAEPPTELPTETPTELPPTTPSPGKGCVHGPFWFPDEINVPNLICICQSSCTSEYSYNCLTASSY